MTNAIEHPIWYPMEFDQLLEEFALADHPALEIWPAEPETCGALEALLQALYGGAWLTEGGETGQADHINVQAALNDPDSVFYTYQQLITLRKTLPLLTWGDYEDLLPEHPSLWCYRRQWQGQTLVVAANLSRELQAWQPAEAPGEWKMIISNYAETTPRPTGLTLRPFEAIWWLQG